jgi:hypothetical protein
VSLRGLTPPARKITSRRSCRLQLEPLEDRLTPSLSLNFIPIAHVAVNPQPLPPGEGTAINVPAVYLEEMPLVTNPIPGVSMQHDHIVGFLSKQITLPASTAGTPSQTWNLEESYNLMLNATTTVTQADPFSGEEGVTASFGLAGTIAATLHLQGSAQQTAGPSATPTLFLTGPMTETGTFVGALSASDPATGLHKLAGTMKWSNITLERGTSSDPALFNWFQHVRGNSQVNMQEVIPPSGATIASFWEQGEVIVSFLEGNPDAPIILGSVDATITSWGSVTDNVLAPTGPFAFPEVDTGASQYTDSLMETITMPDGSKQTLAQTSQDSGTFIIAVLVG